LRNIHARSEERIGKSVDLTLILLYNILCPFLLFLLLISRIQGLCSHGLLEILSSLLLFHHLLVEVLLHLPVPACLLSSKGFAGDFHASSLDLPCRLGQSFEDLIRKHDRLNILQTLSDWWGNIVLLEDLVIRVESRNYVYHPLLVWHVELVDPCDVELLFDTYLLNLVIQGVLYGSSNTVLDPDLICFGTPVSAFKNIH